MIRSEFIAITNDVIPDEVFFTQCDEIENTILPELNKIFPQENIMKKDLTENNLLKIINELKKKEDRPKYSAIILICSNLIHSKIKYIVRLNMMLIDNNVIDEDIIEFVTKNIYKIVGEINYINSDIFLDYLLKINLLSDDIIQNVINNINSPRCYVLPWYINYSVNNPNVKLREDTVNTIFENLYQVSSIFQLLLKHCLYGELPDIKNYYDSSKPIVNKSNILIIDCNEKIISLKTLLKMHSDEYINISNTENILSAIIATGSTELFDEYFKYFDIHKNDILDIIEIFAEMMQNNYTENTKYMLENIFIIFNEKISLVNPYIDERLYNEMWYNLYVADKLFYYKLIEKYLDMINLSELFNFFLSKIAKINPLQKIYEYANLSDSKIKIKLSALVHYMLYSDTQYFINFAASNDYILEKTKEIATYMIYNPDEKGMTNLDDILHVKKIYESLGMEFIFGQDELLMIAEYFDDKNLLETIQNLDKITDMTNIIFDEEFFDVCFGAHNTIDWLTQNGYNKSDGYT